RHPRGQGVPSRTARPGFGGTRRRTRTGARPAARGGRARDGPPMRIVGPEEARRLAVRAQLLDGSARVPATTIRPLGSRQLDPIATVAPPQQLVLWSRLGNFDTAELDRLLWSERSLFEWNAYIWPLETLPVIRGLMQQWRRSRRYKRERW